MIKFKNFLRLNQMNGTKDINKTIFWGISIVILFFMAFMSKDAGISADEIVHYKHAKSVISYYTSFGKDTTALFHDKDLHQYGQSLDNFAQVFNEIFNIDEVFRSRHLFSSIAGWLLILFTGLTAVLLFGWRAGYIAMLLLFFSPRILGHSFNNLKDIPFATAYMVTIYFIIKMLKRLPQKDIKSFAAIAFGIAWAISIRIGGLILIPYLFLFSALYYLIQSPFLSSKVVGEGIKLIPYILITTIVGYFGGLLFWPFGLVSPIKNPMDTLFSMTNYGVSLSSLFEGQLTRSAELPWYYGVKYILISSPIIVFLGLILFIIKTPLRKESKIQGLGYGILVFAFAFPLAYTIYKDSNLYSGWRHILWIYAPLLPLAAGGMNYFLNLKSKAVSIGFGLLFVLLSLHPIKYTFVSHPYQYTYYNQLVGGINGAYGQYEIDPYYHSNVEACKWIIENKINSDTLTIATNFVNCTKYVLRNHHNINIIHSSYQSRSSKYWDYAIWVNTHIPPDLIKNNYWPTTKTIHKISVQNVPVCVVEERKSYDDFYGFQAAARRNPDQALSFFNRYLNHFPNNDEVLSAKARILYNSNKFDSTIIVCNKALELNSYNLPALYYKTAVLNKTGKYKEALQLSNKLIALQQNYAQNHYQQGIALKNLNRPVEAIESFQKATSYRQNYYSPFYEVGTILKNMGDFKQAATVFKQILEFKPNDYRAKLGLAQCYYFTNKFDLSGQILNSFSPQERNYSETVKLQARLYIQSKQHGNAERAIKLLKKIENTDSELNVIKARLLLSQQKMDESIQYLNKAIELDANNREATEIHKRIMVLVQNRPKTIGSQKQNQQSIMYQKPKAQGTNPIQVPTK